ncbi:MAG: hypothetical protein K5746_03040 [Clostridiales bacterium]|nr:hypothetical protein [Clostridiales bacterium]
MDKVKEIFRTVVYGRLVVEGKDGTFVRCPLWLAVVAALAGRRALRFAVLTAILIVAFGMQVRVETGRA